MSKFLIVVMSSIVLLAATMMVPAGCKRPPGPDPEPQYLAFDDYPRWSHSGDKIAFAAPGTRDSVSTYVLYIVDTTGENLHAAVSGGLMVAWLPGDTQLVVMGVDFALYRLDLRTDSLSPFYQGAGFVRFPDIDPSGQYLYYEDAGVADGWATSIYRMDLVSGDTTHIVGGSYPVISPDGNRLLFERGELRCYDLAADSEWVVFDPGFQGHPHWSPDGSEIVVGNVLRDGYYNNLYKVNPDGSNRHFFSTGISPRYSPSGNRIALARFGPDRRSYLWLINPDGGDPTQITF